MVRGMVRGMGSDMRRGMGRGMVRRGMVQTGVRVVSLGDGDAAAVAVERARPLRAAHERHHLSTARLARLSSRPAWGLLGWGSSPVWHTSTPPLSTSERTTAEPALPVAPATTTVGRTSPTERAEAVKMP